MKHPAISDFQAASRMSLLLRIRDAQTNYLKLGLLLAIVILGNGSTISAEVMNTGIVAVYSSVSPDYVRSPLPGGSFKTETYAFGEGGDWGGPSKDDSIDKLKFSDIAQMLAPSLTKRSYLPTNPKDPSKTDILIMVYWGTTNGAVDRAGMAYKDTQIPVTTAASSNPPQLRIAGPASMGKNKQQQAAAIKILDDSEAQHAWTMINLANMKRDRQNLENAAVLGYLPELKNSASYKLTAMRNFVQDVVDDVEENRYFVVLLAYDFQLLWKHKQRKMLWQTRFNIRQYGNDFSKELGNMALIASKYYGKDSEGLIRKPFREAKVTLGDAMFVGYEAEKRQ